MPLDGSRFRICLKLDDLDPAKFEFGGAGCIRIFNGSCFVKNNCHIEQCGESRQKRILAPVEKAASKRMPSLVLS